MDIVVVQERADKNLGTQQMQCLDSGNALEVKFKGGSLAWDGETHIITMQACVLGYLLMARSHMINS